MIVVAPTIKKVFSSILALIGRLSQRRGIPVLLYHSIDSTGSVVSITSEEFRRQMAYLNATGYKTISLPDFLGYLCSDTVPRGKMVVLTFDDGFKNNYTEAFPILREYGFTATIFLATDYIDRVCSWEKHDSIPRLPLLSWDEIKEMSDYGIDFESHTCSHPYLSRLTREEMRKELLGSKKVIETQLNKPVTFFCHPYGDSSRETQEAARECGYVGVFGGLDYSLLNTKEDVYNLSRVGTARFTSLEDFKAGLLGTYDCYITLRWAFAMLLSIVQKKKNFIKKSEYLKVR